jgi:hypothetical protein
MLTVAELEGNGYNYAAELLLAGDEHGAAVDVLAEPGRYHDDYDAATRAKARIIIEQGENT